jgi:hypothetical protein
MVQPAALIQAHSAPMAIEFTNSSAFPEAYRRGAFVVLRGSWNRSVPTGRKVIYVDFSDDQDTMANTVGDFMTGFLTDSTSDSWARPVGFESDMEGNLYLTSNDQTQFVMMISHESSSGVRESAPIDPTGPRIGAAPNPASTSSTVYIMLPHAGIVSLRMFDALGREVRTILDGNVAAGERSVTVDVSDLPAGVYFYRLDAEGMSRVQSVRVVK